MATAKICDITNEVIPDDFRQNAEFTIEVQRNGTILDLGETICKELNQCLLRNLNKEIKSFKRKSKKGKSLTDEKEAKRAYARAYYHAHKSENVKSRDKDKSFDDYQKEFEEKKLGTKHQNGKHFINGAPGKDE